MLAAHGEHTVQPAHLSKGLLDDEMARVVERDGHVEAVAYGPTTGGIGRKRAFEPCSEVAVRLVERTQTVLVGVQPQGCCAVADADLCLCLVAKIVGQTLGCRALRHRLHGCECRQKEDERCFFLHADLCLYLNITQERKE